MRKVGAVCNVSCFKCSLSYQFFYSNCVCVCVHSSRAWHLCFSSQCHSRHAGRVVAVGIGGGGSKEGCMTAVDVEAGHSRHGGRGRVGVGAGPQ